MVMALSVAKMTRCVEKLELRRGCAKCDMHTTKGRCRPTLRILGTRGLSDIRGMCGCAEGPALVVLPLSYILRGEEAV